MQSSGATPPGAVAAPDLAEVARATGPFASIYVVTESGIDNAAHRNELRWKTLRSELAEAGVEEDVLAEVDPHLAQAHLAGPGLAIIATAGGVLHIDHGVEAPTTDRAVWAALPELVPIIRWRQAAPPYM
ncbi:MAG TPA: hypothetical protein VGV67_10900, partial [Solirubrobacteraceae bacterium]|nr:hypothetical protein [Solirubrobacteraceae bacterium]